jgi:hypothetical protein
LTLWRALASMNALIRITQTGWLSMPESVMPKEPSAHSLAEKLRGFEAQLSGAERRLLKAALAAAALAGVVIGVGGAVDASDATSGTTAAGGQTEDAAPLGDLRAQFDGAFTPGVAWETPGEVSIKPPQA